MIDIFKALNGKDLDIREAESPRAANVISTQLGSLEYAPDFGSDMRYFLQANFQFQLESYKSYVIQRLTYHKINVLAVTELQRMLDGVVTFFLGDGSQPPLRAQDFVINVTNDNLFLDIGDGTMLDIGDGTLLDIG